MNPYISRSIKNIITVSKIVHYFYFEFTSDYVDNAESHDFWELVYVESGEVIINCDDKREKLKQNDILFHKPNQEHSIQFVNNGAAKMHFISFYSASKVMSLFEDLKISLPYELKNQLFGIFEEANITFERKVKNQQHFLQPLKNAPLGGQQLYRIYLEAFLIKLARYIEQQKGAVTYNSKTEYEKIVYDKIKQKLDSKLYYDYSVSQLCSELNYSRTYLSTLFKKYSGMSIMQYYNMAKIREAKKLIKSQKYSLSQISDMLKFNNQYYFSRSFKRYEGVAPSEYKQGK